MAIFRSKKDGFWYIDFYFQGSRKREKIGASFKLAQEVLHKRKAEIAERRFFPERQGQHTFKDFMGSYWERHWRFLRGKGGSSIRKELEAHFRDRKLSQITAGDIQDFYNRKRQLTSISTANRHLARLAHMFGKARKWKDFAGELPTKDVEKQREEGNRIRFLSHEEIQILLAQCDPRIYPILVCALHTGMRRGEILDLRWENVDLERGLIFVVKSKSGKPRELYITPQLRDVLVSLGQRKEGLIFEIAVITLRRCFDRALRKTNITDFCFHSLRHTFASHFIMRTSDLAALQQILGHSSLKMTMRYAHLAKSHVSAQMRSFAGVCRCL